MKRIDRTTALLQARLDKRRWKQRLARAPGRINKVKWVVERIPAPEIFSFSRNYNETVGCLQRLKVAVHTKPPRRVRRRVYLDLSTIREISVAGALVMAAEIDRWRTQKKTKVQPRDVDNWDTEVKRTLNGLGFFQLLGVTIAQASEPTTHDREITVLRMISNEKLAQAMVGSILEYMTAVAGILEQDPAIYAALIEATYNTTLHAYPRGYQYKFPPLLTRWWVTSCWSPKENVVRFFVYDQGVGIPETLPRWERWEYVREMVSKMPLVGSATKDASSMIEAAIEISRTSIGGKSGHGKGLKDVVTPIEGVEGASVRILSGKGGYICYGDGKTEKNDEQLHLGGTLIEWTIPIGVADRR